MKKIIKPISMKVFRLIKTICPAPNETISPAPNETISPIRIKNPRILFALLSGSIYSSVASVISAAKEREDALTQVMIFENQYNNTRTKDFFQLKEHLTKIDVPFSYYSEKSVREFSPDVVILVVPYFDMYPNDFWSYVSKKAKIVYIPYGQEIGGSGLNQTYQFNLLVHKKAWRIFARSNNHRRMYARYKDNGSANVVVTGSPRTDLYSNLDDMGNKVLREKIGNRIAVLWAPHFSVMKDEEPDAWSSFLYVKDHILQAFKDRSDSYFLIFRGHPLLCSRLHEKGIWSFEEIDKFKNKILALGNSFIDESSNYMHVFKESDAIITDASSFLLEYLWVNKPILYTSPPNGYGLNDDAKNILKAVALLGESPAKGLNKFLSSINNENDPLKSQREQARKKIFYRPKNGNTVGEEIIQNIISSCKKGDFFIPPLHSVNTDERANSYWKTSSNTYLASAEYYDRQESTFKQILIKLGSIETAVDVGCGDGRYTFILAQHANHVHASDISENLLLAARKTAEKNSINNITFFNDNILDIKYLGRYNLVTCMGVLSGIVSEARFARALYTLKALIQPKGGRLILKESLSNSNPKHTPVKSEYTCIYRNHDQYLNCIESLGFELIEKVPLSMDEKSDLVNYLFLFELREQMTSSFNENRAKGGNIFLDKIDVKDFFKRRSGFVASLIS